jgi:hypothetical protein
MLTADVCKVCGREPGPYDSLCFGVHANCSNDLRVDRAYLFRVHDVRRPENVWYCTKNGMRVIEDHPQWLTDLHTDEPC